MPHPETFGPEHLLRGRVEHRDGHVEFFIAGDLDLTGADPLRTRLVTLGTESPGDLILDLGQLEFLDSTGIRALILTQQELARSGRRLVLRNARGSVHRVLELTGLIGQLAPEESGVDPGGAAA